MVSASMQDESSVHAELDVRLEFEALLADLSARFVNLPAEDVDREIVEAQRQLCACLGVDGSSVWQRSSDEPATMHRTHIYRVGGKSPPSDELGGQDRFPWMAGQVLSGKPVIVSNTSNTPPDAARDRETWAHFGVKSALALPLSTGGGPVFGVLSFDTLNRVFDWPEAIVTRCQIVAQIFGNAIARKRSDRALHRSEERFRSIADNLPVAVYEFNARPDGQWGLRYMSPRIREVCGLDPEPIDTFYDRFASCVVPEDRKGWKSSIEDALEKFQPWQHEFRFMKPTGETVYLRGQAQLRRIDGGLIAAGILQDVSARRRAEDALCESQTTLNALIDSTSDLIWSVDCESFGLLTFNRGLRDYFLEHRKIQIQPGMRPEDLFPPGEYVQRWHDFYQKAMREGPYTTEYAVYSRTRILLLSFSILRREGRVFGISVFGKDITEQKKADDELRRTLDELSRLKEQLQHENVYLRKEVQTLQGETPIVGISESLRKVLAQAQQVAATESTVLILGETGTGKELLASYLHSIGRRSAKPFITTNVAAIPSTLLESELFGREKGAYTGAMTRQIGRFEMADGGTIFLDEIGELPMETQVKLLRVLQRGEFERLGSSQTRRVNVQVIAATNRKLPELIRDGKFRQDLYYRLNVFPIVLPPLRERPDDIPLLVWTFIQEFSEKMGKSIDRIHKKDLAAMQACDWPGNVRELRNVVERSMILAAGPELRLILPESQTGTSSESRLLRDVERAHIEKVLLSTGGRIRGPHGAAEVLGLKPPTLYFKMERLGIPRKREGA